MLSDWRDDGASFNAVRESRRRRRASRELPTIRRGADIMRHLRLRGRVARPLLTTGHLQPRHNLVALSMVIAYLIREKDSAIKTLMEISSSARRQRVERALQCPLIKAAAFTWSQKILGMRSSKNLHIDVNYANFAHAQL